MNNMTPPPSHFRDNPHPVGTAAYASWELREALKDLGRELAETATRHLSIILVDAVAWVGRLGRRRG